MDKHRMTKAELWEEALVTALKHPEAKYRSGLVLMLRKPESLIDACAALSNVMVRVGPIVRGIVVAKAGEVPSSDALVPENDVLVDFAAFWFEGARWGTGARKPSPKVGKPNTSTEKTEAMFRLTRDLTKIAKDDLSPSRETSLAITNLEQSAMWFRARLEALRGE